jgi:small subunit ribosomal protein S16
MDEPKEGATTMKKKAQEKLAAKANPAPVVEEVVSEPTATEEVAVEAVVEAPVEVAAEAVVEAPAAEATTEEAAE